VWSVGMLLYTLFTYKEPFPDVKKKIQSVTDNELSKLFGDNITSKTLKTLLMDFCKRTPSDRLTFRKIIDKFEKNQSQNQILKELDFTETLIQIIWEKAKEDCKATNDIEPIDFNMFYLFLFGYCQVKKPEEAHSYYLKEALRLPYFLKLGEPDPKYMTRDNFGVIARLFKLTKKNDDSFLQRIVDLFKEDWFYGGVDRIEAQRQLEATQRKKSDGTYFIVRFASSKQLCFTFKKDEKEPQDWENSTIDTNNALKPGYAKYISQFVLLKGLKHDPIAALKTFKPCPTANKKNK